MSQPRFKNVAYPTELIYNSINGNDNYTREYNWLALPRDNSCGNDGFRGQVIASRHSENRG